MARILAEFLAHAKTYYRNGDGLPSREYQNFLAAMKPLKSLYADTLAAEFGPRALAGLQKQMIRLGWARTYINRQMGRTKLIFKWAAAQELIPVQVFQALMTVLGLRRGKTEARETDPVKPVAEHWKQLVIPHVSRQVAGMIDLMAPSRLLSAPHGLPMACMACSSLRISRQHG